MRKRILSLILICLFSFIYIQAQEFRFALITDTHLRANDSSAYDDLQRTVEHINQSGEYAFVLVTGDLTEEGDRLSLQRAKEVLDRLQVTYYALSGNHETKWSESGATDFARIFGSERFDFEYSGYRFLGFGTGPVIRMMDGHVAPQDINWLKKELTQTPEKPVFLVTHYPLLPGDVDNWYEVTDVVREFNIKAFLGGHYHTNRLLSYDGIPAFLCRSNLRDKEDQVGGYTSFEVKLDSIVAYEQKPGYPPKKWGGYSLTQTYYTKDITDYPRPDYSVNSQYNNVKEEWLTHTQTAMYASPWVYQGKLFIGDDEGNFMCYRIQDGKQVWKYQTGGRIVGTADAANGVVVFGSADNNIYALQVANGRLLWKYTAQEPVLGSARIDNNRVYIGASDGTFRAFDLKTGRLLWEYKEVKGYIETRPLIYDGKVIFGAWDNTMYALDANSGTLAWKWDGELTRMHFSPAAVWPVATEGKVFFTAPDRVMTALDANTGKTVWRTKESMVRETIGLSEDEKRVYSKTMQDSVVCYSTIGDQPHKLWSVNVGYGYDHAASMPVEKEGVVFGSTKNGIVFALEGKSGKLLWKHKVGNSLVGTVFPLSRNECIFVSSEGVIGKLKAEEDIQQLVEDYLTEKVKEQTFIPPIKIDSMFIEKKTIRFFANPLLSYRTYRPEDMKEIQDGIRKLLPLELRSHSLELFSDGYNIENYIPFSRKEFIRHKVTKPLVINISKAEAPKKGLTNRHIALWQSHGWYYEQKLARWEWQRARIFQTVEDLYTQSYVLPYLVPMLENAGANVLLPRERDTQRYEIIVDKEKSSGNSIYRETNGKEEWKDGQGSGFAHLKEIYVDGENPFKAGSYREVKTIQRGSKSSCEWIPDIPEKGKYAVYVSYQTLLNSTDDARYTIHHLGGATEFSVNQQMGGGTWIYLGHFLFDKGIQEEGKIVLSNEGDKAGKILTADAVKIGGGMGNIARLPIIEDNSENKGLPISYIPEISGYPRYTEGARYWLQWAGAPDSIYNRSESRNDYTDDFQSRGFWVNYLAGGSSVLPEDDGLHIPVDLAFAFHTDAGTTFNDSIIGTLGICMTHTNEEKFAGGKSRLASRDLTDLIMTNIVNDIRNTYDPEWTQRAVWNRSYSEARVPEVPTMLLELLSHQNLADMRYGLDPRFRFTVSRSIYKGMLKYLAAQYGVDYVVQPLPVNGFSASFSGNNSVTLQWNPVDDPLEPTATPQAYKVYTRIGEEDFNNGIIVKDTQINLPIENDRIYSFKICALNEGGESFPSEILSVCRKSNEKGQILIVNGFTRLSAPHSFATTDSLGGFVDFIDHGVPDGKEYHYTGSQYEFRRSIPWMDDDAPGFGASQATYETTVIAGNTFDYPFVHGEAIADNGYSFVSCGIDAIFRGQIQMNDYPMVDLILGKQKKTKMGNETTSDEFKTFPAELQTILTDYCLKGGALFISGAYVASDFWDTEHLQEEEKSFATDILKYKWRVDRAAVEGKVKSVASPFPTFDMRFIYHNKLNPDCYAVESPDAIEPADNSSYTIFRYEENNLSAGVAYKGEYKTCILGFPFETIRGSSDRKQLMGSILQFMFDK